MNMKLKKYYDACPNIKMHIDEVNKQTKSHNRNIGSSILKVDKNGKHKFTQILRPLNSSCVPKQ